MFGEVGGGGVGAATEVRKAILTYSSYSGHVSRAVIIVTKPLSAQRPGAD